jgi:hypothetical protein
MLIHMSPREVQGLQALAVQQGGSLTINPDTGLPEAGFLDKMLPAIIGFGISAASGGTIDPMTAAAIVGGVETVRTGDIGRGIGAGFQAYGGANLGASFAGAGEGLIGEQALAGSVGREAVARNIMENQMTEEAARSAVMKEAVGNAGTFEKLGAGFEAATGKGGMQALKAASPMGAPGLGYSAAMAGGPAILAEMSAKKNMPQTVTQPGMIRPYSYDPISQQYFGGTPYRAAEGGLMGMAAGGMAGYGDGDDVPRRTIDGMAQGGMYDFAQRSEPVVRMASGGIAGYAAGGAPTILSDADLFAKTGSWEAAAAARDAQNNALNQYNWAQQAAQANQAANIASDAARLSAAAGSNTNAQANQTQTQTQTAATQNAAATPAAVTPDASDWWAKQPGGLNAMYDTINQQLAANPNMTDAQVVD